MWDKARRNNYDRTKWKERQCAVARTTKITIHEEL